MTPLPLALATLLLLPGQGTNPSSPGLDFGEPQFRQGLDSLADATTARRHFADAARGYDLTWRAGRQTRDVALMRGRAHFLAGNLPQAIRAFREGLDHYPWDADLQQGLALCRGSVAYPTESDPTERVRPDPVTSLRYRVSPWDLLVLAAIFSGLVTAGLARRLTAAEGWSVPVAAVGLTGLFVVAAVAALVERDRQHDREFPVVVVAEDSLLRTGNGPSYPTRLELPLPRGAEVRMLARRGGWVQVELPGGAAGWVPEPVILNQ